MTCQIKKEDILDCFYDEVQSSYKDTFLKHKQTCQSCTQEWEGLNQVHTLFKRLPQKTIPAILLQEVKQIIYSEKQVISNSFAKDIINYFKSFQFQLRVAPALVGLVLLVSVFTVLRSEQSFKSHGVVLGGDEPFELTSWIKSTPSDGLPQGLQSVSLGENSSQPGNPPPLTVSDLQQLFEDRKNQMMELDADMLLMRGRRAKAMGRIDLALKDFETIYRFYPNYSYMGDVLMYRAQCYAFKGRYQEAIDSLVAYQDIYPSKKPLIEPMILQLKKASTEK